MSGQRIDYIRVSTVDQNTERQLDGIELDKTFTDKASGKDAKRPLIASTRDYAPRLAEQSDLPPDTLHLP
jgi:DNA invertase Pin-like site-specific DNA recombinase